PRRRGNLRDDALDLRRPSSRRGGQLAVAAEAVLLRWGSAPSGVGGAGGGPAGARCRGKPLLLSLNGRVAFAGRADGAGRLGGWARRDASGSPPWSLGARSAPAPHPAAASPCWAACRDGLQLGSSITSETDAAMAALSSQRSRRSGVFSARMRSRA